MPTFSFRLCASVRKGWCQPPGMALHLSTSAASSARQRCLSVPKRGAAATLAVAFTFVPSRVAVGLRVAGPGRTSLPSLGGELNGIFGAQTLGGSSRPTGLPLTMEWPA